MKVTLLFKREFSYYLLTIYVPSCMLVIVSWISFWLDSKSVPARVSLGVTTLLTVSTQTAGVNRSLPPVAYTKVKYLLHPSSDRQALFFDVLTYLLLISSLEKPYTYSVFFIGAMLLNHGTKIRVQKYKPTWKKYSGRNMI